MILNINQLEQLPFPYFIIDRNLRILFRSKTALKELSSGEDFMELVEYSSRPQFNSFLFNMPDCPSINVRLLKKNLEWLSFTMYKTPAAENCHLFCFPHEIESRESSQIYFSHQEQAAENTGREFKKSSLNEEHFAALGKLAAGIAHEIRNPLTAVKGFIQLLKPYLSEIGKSFYADVAIEEIDRANEIIFEFLNQAKPNEKKTMPVFLNHVIRDIYILYKSEAILRNITITAKYDEKDALIHLDSKQLKHVLTNLLNNAMEAIEESMDGREGSIQLQTKWKKNHAVIIIEDNGCGMDAETLNQLFLPYHTTKEKGTGIGLAMCREIIEDHGGSIEIESTLNLGTQIKIILPIAQEAKINTYV